MDDFNSSHWTISTISSPDSSFFSDASQISFKRLAAAMDCESVFLITVDDGTPAVLSIIKKSISMVAKQYDVWILQGMMSVTTIFHSFWPVRIGNRPLFKCKQSGRTL